MRLGGDSQPVGSSLRIRSGACLKCSMASKLPGPRLDMPCALSVTTDSWMPFLVSCPPRSRSLRLC